MSPARSARRGRYEQCFRVRWLDSAFSQRGLTRRFLSTTTIWSIQTSHRQKDSVAHMNPFSVRASHRTLKSHTISRLID